MKQLSEAKTDSAADFQKFEEDAEIRINENQKKIVALKTKKSDATREVKEN